MASTLTGWPAEGAGLAREPQALLPGRVESWPVGHLRGQGAADALFAGSLGYWNTSYHREGSRMLRNLGIARDLLDLRFGSSDAPNSNEPTWLGPQAQGYVYLPGFTGCNMSVPDSAPLRITGNIDIRVCVALDDWTPAAQATLLAKYASGAGLLAYLIDINPAGTVRFLGSSDGSTVAVNVSSTDAPSIANGGMIWVRVTRDWVTGEVKFYTSVFGIVWVQLGTTVTAAAGALYPSTSAVYMGTRSDGVSNPAAGKFYRAQILNGIDGAAALDVDCDAITSSDQATIVERSVNAATVTIASAASGRKASVVPSAAKGGAARLLFGTDDFLECLGSWQHQILGFGKGDSFTAWTVMRRRATTDYDTLMSKALDREFAPGWMLRAGQATSTTTMIVNDGAISWGASNTSPAYTLGSTVMATAVINRDTRRNDVYAGTSSQGSLMAFGSLATPAPFRLGATGTGTHFADIELVAAGIDRRAWTAANLAIAATKNWGA